MLSPPTLTGVMPANRRTLPTRAGSMYDSGGFMWLAHEETRSMPSTWMRSRSSDSPCTLGRLDTPPAPTRLTPGRLRSSCAVSLSQARPACRLAASAALAPSGWVAERGAVTLTASSALSWAPASNGRVARKAQRGRSAKLRGHAARACQRFSRFMANQKQKGVGRARAAANSAPARSQKPGRRRFRRTLRPKAVPAQAGAHSCAAACAVPRAPAR